MRNCQWPVLMFTFILLIPSAIWYTQTGTLAVYFTEVVPKGQFLYVLSKLAGMIVLMGIAWQVIVTLLSKLNMIPDYWVGIRHRVFGSFILLFAITHILLFVIAVSMRQDSVAWSLLLPSFKDFYHTHLTFGLFGLLILFVVAYAGAKRMSRYKKWSVLMHRLYWVATSFIYFHALVVGSESQSQAGLILYSSLAVIAVMLGLAYSIQQLRMKIVAAP